MRLARGPVVVVLTSFVLSSLACAEGVAPPKASVRPYEPEPSLALEPPEARAGVEALPPGEAPGAAARAPPPAAAPLPVEGASLDAVKAVARGAAKEGNLEVARSAYRLWLAEDRLDPAPAIGLGRLELEKGDRAAAARLADEALVRDLSSAEAFHLKGRVLLAEKQLSAAAAAFEGAVARPPGHALAFNNLCQIHLKAGEWGRAVEALSAATLLRPDVAYMHNNLGLAYEKLGQTSEALAEYRTAVVLAPRYGSAAANLRRLSALAAAPGRAGFDAVAE